MKKCETCGQEIKVKPLVPGDLVQHKYNGAVAVVQASSGPVYPGADVLVLTGSQYGTMLKGAHMFWFDSSMEHIHGAIRVTSRESV